MAQLGWPRFIWKATVKTSARLYLQPDNFPHIKQENRSLDLQSFLQLLAEFGAVGFMTSVLHISYSFSVARIPISLHVILRNLLT